MAVHRICEPKLGLRRRQWTGAIRAMSGTGGSNPASSARIHEPSVPPLGEDCVAHAPRRDPDPVTVSIEDTFDNLPQTSVSVPLLGECGTALEKIFPVFGHQQFDLFEGLAAWRRRGAAPGRMKIQVFRHCLLSEIGKIPVEKQARRIGEGPLGWK